jgi:hypothetical protein
MEASTSILGESQRWEGMTCSPSLLPKNPTATERLPYSKVEAATEFVWVKEIINPRGLELKDTNTIKLLPFITVLSFITGECLKSLSEANQRIAL